MLPRVLELEVMDTDDDAREYDAMDHREINAQFVTDFLVACGTEKPARVLDLGTGSALIAIELCRRAPWVFVTAVDAADSMLALARKNIAAAGVADRIELVKVDAKRLPFDALLPAVMSNSIIHHIPEPREFVAEAARVTAPGGWLFHRDLCRPRDEAHLEQLVAKYSVGNTPYQRRLFAESLCAAITVNEMRDIVAKLGFAADSVQMTAEHRWTWSARKS